MTLFSAECHAEHALTELENLEIVANLDVDIGDSEVEGLLLFLKKSIKS